IVADSFNNLSDSMSSVVALYGFRVTATPADREHPFGHGRAEYIASLAISGIIIIVGLGAARASVLKIFRGGELDISGLTLVMLGASVLIKLWLAGFYKKIGILMKSGTLKTAAADSIADTISTSAALLCGVLFFVSGVDIDAYIGLGMSLFVIYTGIRSAKEAVTPLLGAAPDDETVSEIEKTVRSFDGVIGVHDLLIHNYGVGISMISLHAEVPGNMDLLSAHAVIDNIETELRERFGCDVTIHMDPQDDGLRELRETLTRVIEGISTEISMHDLHRLPGSDSVAFDIVTPFEFELSDDALRERIASELLERDVRCGFVITIDKE
ncbi:MAG: cation transporter, partial [Clostridiales bacterium]|nr:cation transporter [Clostridiales bacterium]